MAGRSKETWIRRFDMNVALLGIFTKTLLASAILLLATVGLLLNWLRRDGSNRRRQILPVLIHLPQFNLLPLRHLADRQSVLASRAPPGVPPRPLRERSPGSSC
jgi:hypothetical protein